MFVQAARRALERHRGLPAKPAHNPMRGLAPTLLSPPRFSPSLSSLLTPPFRFCVSTSSTPLLLSTRTPAAQPPPPPTRPRTPDLKPPRARLTPEEVAQVNRLVPRLCDSNHLREAVRLLDACLLTDDPALLDSLPLPHLVRRLCCREEPDMTHAMALLTALLHNPRCSAANLTVICSMLVGAYLDHGRPREALKVFDWMRRPKSPCPPEPDVYWRLIGGLCRHGNTLEALRVLREMVVGGDWGCEAVGADARACLYRSLLREARVRDAQELDGALALSSSGSSGERGDGVCSGTGRVVEVLDRVLKDWRED